MSGCETMMDDGSHGAGAKQAQGCNCRWLILAVCDLVAVHHIWLLLPMVVIDVVVVDFLKLLGVTRRML